MTGYRHPMLLIEKNIRRRPFLYVISQTDSKKLVTMKPTLADWLHGFSAIGKRRLMSLCQVTDVLSHTF